MKIEFVNYLNEIGITTEVLINKIEEIYETFCRICSEDFIDIFVEDIMNQDNMREFIGISFFSDNYVASMSNFLVKESIIITSFNKKIDFVIIDKKNFNLDTAAETSRMSVEAQFSDGNWGGKATGKNCEYLNKIVGKYFIPNIAI